MTLYITLVQNKYYDEVGNSIKIPHTPCGRFIKTSNKGGFLTPLVFYLRKTQQNITKQKQKQKTKTKKQRVCILKSSRSPKVLYALND